MGINKLRTRPQVQTSALTAVVPLLLSTSLALAACESDAQATIGASESEAVRALDVKQLNALVDADMATLDRIIAPDFVLVSPPGDRETRQEYLDSVASGDLDYRAFKPIPPVDVDIDGNLAVLTFESELDVSAGDIHLTHRAWHTHVYEKRDDRWQIVWAQATAVGGFPPS